MTRDDQEEHIRKVLADRFGTAYRKGPEDFAQDDMMKRNKYDRERERRMRACPCLLCFWALSPARTYAEHKVRMAVTRKANENGGWMTHKESA